MTHHSTAFEIERLVPVDEAVTEPLLAPPENALGDAPAPAARQKFNFRRMLLTSAAAAVLAGAVWSVHPTAKTVALVADAIRDCSHRSGVILDSFGGPARP
jgi:hypothetical protein